ncbi:DUF317 domain-containing protein [Streptomyces sp. A5-4]|uniref:DUF317 domain-containing protein n=1 Tax=Streptomyces sp. A5-4 TaxID=3384771 RepID=UPI003DA7E73A
MTKPAPDAHVRLDSHPAHSSAVTASLTGAEARIAHLALEADGWTPVAENILVLARIDSEEPYWAQQAANALNAEGITTEITPGLREAIDEEWTWANYPMPWCTRSEIREVSAEAQKIHDDIRHGHLLMHAHAEDGHTTVAVGTYLSGGKSVYLHGENHLRQIADTFDSPAQALLAFEKVHGAAMRPGPAPLTDTERAAGRARTSLTANTVAPEPQHQEPESAPAYAADAGDHDALLDAFVDAHADWEKWRTWSDETTHVIHESQTLRIERIHDAPAHETAWTVAAYETPVSDRMWVLTATGTTPAPVLQELLNHLADGDGWDTAVGAPVDEKTVTAATQPLTDAGWDHTVDGRWIRWTTPAGDAGVQFDAFAAQHHPEKALATWTIWAGPNHDCPTWTLNASPHTPSSLLAGLAAELAEGQGMRTKRRRTHSSSAPSTTPSHLAATPSPPAAAHPRRSR